MRLFGERSHVVGSGAGRHRRMQALVLLEATISGRCQGEPGSLSLRRRRRPAIIHPMKALVYTAPEKVEIQTLPEPTPADGEVLLEISAAGICGSDIHGFLG